MSALRHLQRCEIGGGFIILQINAVFERLYTRSSHSRRFPEKSGLGLTNEQTGVGARSNLSFKLEQTEAFPTRSEEHSVGKAWIRKCRSRVELDHAKKRNKTRLSDNETQ